MDTGRWIAPFFAELNGLFTTLIPLLLGSALLLFIWGVLRYFMWGAGDPAEREAGRIFMLYALIGLVAIVGMWGIVNLLLVIFGIGATTPSPLPAVRSF